LNIDFAIKADDWQVLEKKIADYPGNAENTINSYLHGEGAEFITQGVTKYIPVSTGRYSAHANLKRKYKHKKTGAHAKNAEWYQTNKFNLAINITNIRDYYYLYFVQNGLGTSERTGGVQFLDLGIDSVYAKVLEGIHEALNREV
jgi:hypothetical protein